MKERTIVSLLVFALSAFLWVQSAPAQTEEEDLKVRTRRVSGQLMYHKRGMLSLETSPTSEIVLLVDPEVRVKHARGLSDLHRGDHVSVLYEETYSEDPNERRPFLKRSVKEISLVRRATDGLRGGK